MSGTTLRRRGSMVAAGTLLVAGMLLIPSVASASGGGGCGRRVTDAAGVTITIRQFCFGPTILRIAPGETVTWINRDSVAHTVVGANAVWGDFSTLKRADQVAYRFVRPGIYPYVCTYHPGMVGAVVVGDGTGRGSAGRTTTVAGPVALVDLSTVPREDALGVAPVIRAPTGLGDMTGGFAAALIVSSLAALAWIVARRRRGATGTS